ncbi:MAG: lysophospholipid acyltransferase family protein [Rhodospirillales bacterium]|nr:lysophospholipid acyltransferase family protein [Rhodospirillales bacterium]
MATPGFIKAISRSPAVRAAACFLGAQYLRLVWITGRWRVEGFETVQRFWDQDRPFIVCFWHGRLLMMPLTWKRPKPFHMLLSDHPDGRLGAEIGAHFGIKCAYGSSTRGGTAALRQLVKILRDGGTVGMTPDGPAGPRMRASIGAVVLARLSGAPILPLTFSSSSRRALNSWDRFIVPFPFGRGIIRWGTPIEVPKDADDDRLEAARLQLENAMNALTEAADRDCGQAPMEPAPAAVEAAP